MFLKRIELSGFKSFADPTMIRFDDGVTGIVGPNGCGKSNITDAIRWVLGEQSTKSLRSGNSMTDIIFSGSQSRKPVNTAKVTLVFDNTQKIFDSPFEEIEITREVRRSTQETSCYLNKTPCRLKDISELVMDTGLGRDSLSIITQGNISSFADAKPEERRLLFEEAAGVAKYKKRKKISLSKLENVKNNLDRVQDLIENLQEQKESLQEQAEKAKEYIKFRDELSTIEIGLLATRIQQAKSQIDQWEEDLRQARLKQAQSTRKSGLLDEKLQEISKEGLLLDQQISALQGELSSLMQNAYSLQKQKTALDEKRKYALSQEDLQAQKASLTALCKDAQFEYEDRRKRLHEQMMNQEAAARSFQQKKSELEQLQQRREVLQTQVQNRRNQLLVVQGRLSAPVSRNHGVQAILNASRKLRGIEGTVASLIQASDGYEGAISTALASSSDQIVVDTEQSAREAIGYLKKTRQGRATFLPLTVCKSRSLASWQESIASRLDGILGTTLEFAQFNDRYTNLAGRLLGGILVADTLEHASFAAKALKFSVKIVTLDGDVVHSGGAMSGGSKKNSGNSQASLKQEEAQLQSQIDQLEADIERMDYKIQSASSPMERAQEQLMQLRIDQEKLKNIVDVKKEKFESLFSQLKQLDSSATLENTQTDEISQKLSELHARQDEINSDLQLKRSRRMAISEQMEQIQNEIRAERKSLSAISADVQKTELAKARMETRMEQDLMRLSSEYSLTWEAASQTQLDMDPDQAQAKVKSLRRSMSALGDVNLKAPAQYEEVSEKFSFLSSQKEELEDAARQILEAVDEMDQTMTVQFADMFEKINGQLDGIFKAMFGGGSAKLSLTDPSDMLNTGIDVDVQPPGKAVKNLQTFSGGEKALIAISVLFAILKARTIPLCIFDEVEAALDQANVERFARYLSQFKDQSQFIVVTHRPGTMEQCESLYGITMQKDGVSQVLKVLLQDAVEMGK